MNEIDAIIQKLRVMPTVSEPTSDECPSCGGLGYIAWRDESGELHSRECKCAIVQQNRRRIERSGLASLLDRCTFDQFQTLEPWQVTAKKMAQGYVSDCMGKWFFIGGNSGTGKTHLCTAICGCLMEGGVPVRYLQWRADVPAIKAKVNDAEAYRDAVRPLKQIRVLYIDDFLKGSVTEGDRNIAFDILNDRYNDPRAITIISTEMTIDRILEWDEAVGGRIVERAKEYTINLRGKRNWRLK